ncbi:TRAP transporter substrate-binding protein [Deferribacteraceae bacterium V6Fe1]|nr:TRAP transporter substrate-binding protein [Deferribacteraceae bacterium V6Fe1]
MRSVKMFLKVFSVVILVLAMSTVNVFAKEKEKNILLKMPLAFPSTLPILGEGAVYFADLVNSMDDTIKVKIFEPGKLMPAFEIHDAVSTGKVNAGYTISGYIQGKIPAAAVFSALPFGPTPEVFGSWFTVGNGSKLYQEMYDNAGFNVRVFPITIYTAETAGWYKKPIESIDDFKGLKIRFYGLGGKVLAKLGASVVLLPGAEIFPALEKGAIDATEFSMPVVDKKLGFYKIAKYNYFPGWHQPSSTFELLINKETWNSMSPRQQAVIQTAVNATNYFTLTKSIAVQGKVLMENEEKGVKNMKFNDEIVKKLRQTWNEVLEEETAKDPFFKKVIDDQKQYFKEVNKFINYSTLPFE